MPEFRYLRLKDLVNCKFTVNPAYDGAGEKGSDQGNYLSGRVVGKYICPITLLEMNGKHQFCVIRKSGTVVSVKAVRCVRSSVC